MVLLLAVAAIVWFAVATVLVAACILAGRADRAATVPTLRARRFVRLADARDSRSHSLA